MKYKEKAELLWNQNFIVTERFRAEVRLWKVPSGEKFPDGLKAKFVLIDMKEKCARVLIDNHAPFGFHLHAGLPENKSIRKALNVVDFYEAYDIFLEEVEGVIEIEKQK